MPKEPFDVRIHGHVGLDPYRGSSLKRKRTFLGPYHMPMPKVLGESQRGGRFIMGEEPL